MKTSSARRLACVCILLGACAVDRDIQKLAVREQAIGQPCESDSECSIYAACSDYAAICSSGFCRNWCELTTPGTTEFCGWVDQPGDCANAPSPFPGVPCVYNGEWRYTTASGDYQFKCTAERPACNEPPPRCDTDPHPDLYSITDECGRTVSCGATTGAAGGGGDGGGGGGGDDSGPGGGGGGVTCTLYADCWTDDSGCFNYRWECSDGSVYPF
jgi:hypothetical protein